MIVFAQTHRFLRILHEYSEGVESQNEDATRIPCSSPCPWMASAGWFSGGFDMKLQFLGANRQVTGSRYLLRAGGKKILIDCGLFQERKFLARNWEQSPIPPSEVDVLLLTHAHLDHCGLIPKFVREGFRGDILATAPTMDLARIVWEDSARIQVEDAAYKQRRHKKQGRRGPFPDEPLYTPDDAQAAMKHLKLVEYDKSIALGEGVSVVYRDAGHIIGSAMLEISTRDSGIEQKIVFSGDIGTTDRPLLKDPQKIQEANYIVMESTYGDRNHKEVGKEADVLARVVNETIDRGGNLIIPTFAIDRAQEILYIFGELAYSKRIPQITVFFDSPMAIKATEIYKRYKHLLDDETHALLKAGMHPFQFPGLHFVRTPAESISINSKGGSNVILAGSGMCTGGRVKHHLRRNLSRPESTVLFAGYQAHGTLGRRILQGDPVVRIHGKEYTVRAKIEELNSLSAHADRMGLMDWLSGFQLPPKTLFLTHGEIKAAQSLAKHVHEKLEWNVDIPEYDSTVDL